MADTTTPTISTPLQGLTESEVQLRRSKGMGNNAKLQTSRTYTQIIRENVFTFINNLLFVIGGFLAYLGRWSDAITSVSVILINIIVNVVQEVRAKRKLDQITLLTRPKAMVIREGQKKVIDPSEIVIGDILVVTPGDQIVVDGVAVGPGRIDVDESQLTGESDLIRKEAGAKVFSGSFCVTGTICYEVQKVGTDSLANQITSGARAFRRVLTPLQVEVNLVVRVLVLLVAFFGILLLVNTWIYSLSIVESVQIAAVIAALVPNGLFMMIALSYAMGALRIAGKGALIQQSNAVESLSNVDVLCLDKTGTLTSNQIQLHSLHPISGSEAEFRRVVGNYASSTPAGNRTNEAIAEGCGGKAFRIQQEIPFSSERKWSAICFDDPEMHGIFVLGAPEMLSAYVEISPATQEVINEGSAKGLRVLIFASHPQVSSLFNASDKPQLPTRLSPIGIIWFSDVLRAEAKETLAAFAKEGITVKIISGDNPFTVSALAKQAGLGPDIKVVSGPELEMMTEAEFAQVAEETTIFGRITPTQKEGLVKALRSRNHYVAMIGDGVNDVLSLKQANLGISMESGSQATRSVADVVLLGDSFASLPAAFQEGNRIRNGMQDILKIFMTRVLFTALIIICTGVTVGITFFPFTPTQSSLFVLFTVGIPVFGISLWAPSGTVPRASLIRSIIHFVVPAALVLAFSGLAIYLGYLYVNLSSVDTEGLSETEINLLIDGAKPIAQSALVTFTPYCGLLLVVFVQPPLKFLSGGDEYSGDWRPSILALVILVCFFIVLTIPAGRKFFDLQLLPVVDYLMLGGFALLFAIIMLVVWKAQLLDRFIGISLQKKK